MTRITVDEVREMLESGEDFTVVDSRSDDAWKGSDVKAAGAIRIPPDSVEEHISDINRDRKVVTYCT